MTAARRDDEITEDRLVAATNYAAYIVVRYGEAYAPTFERLEKELVEMRRRRTPMERARLALGAHTLDGGMKAIS